MTESAAVPTSSDPRWVRIALWLVIATMVYNAIEAGIAIYGGVRASSIALVGFGLDSIIELLAASLLLWRVRVEYLGADAETLEAADDKVHRFVGLTFFALALYVTLQAGWILWRQDAPSESRLGIALAIASMVIMPLVAWGKIRAADHLGSRALRAEAKETLACSWLSFALLLGLGLNAWIGWWWADPVAALVMVPWLVKEGREGWEGEECGCD